MAFSAFEGEVGLWCNKADNGDCAPADYDDDDSDNPNPIVEAVFDERCADNVCSFQQVEVSVCSFSQSDLPLREHEIKASLYLQGHLSTSIEYQTNYDRCIALRLCNQAQRDQNC